MTNKEIIKKLKDNAELAQAAYGYFHLIGKVFDNKDENKGRKNKEITQTDILDITYNGYITSEHITLINPEKLNGDFTPLQAKRFFERYDLLIHQPNTDSGFSATLFGEKRKQKNTETKEIKYTKEHGYINYILAIRGTESFTRDMWITDFQLAIGILPNQYEDMILFYYQCIGKIPFYVELDSMPKDKNSQDYKLWQKLYQRSKDSKYKPYIKETLLKDSNKNLTQDNFTPPIDSKTKLTITGHSLGGCLTQMFVLSFASYAKRDCGIINEVYTYNAPGARELAPQSMGVIPINYSNLSSYDDTAKEVFIRQYINGLDLENIAQRFFKRLQFFRIRTTYQETLKYIKEQLLLFLQYGSNDLYETALQVGFTSTQQNGSILKEYRVTFETIDSVYADTLNRFIDNYYFHKEKGQGVDIGLQAYHIETDSDNNPNNIENKLIQNLGEDIEGKHYYLNIGIDIKGMERHSIKSSTIILYFYEYLLDLKFNRELLNKHMQELEANRQDIKYQSHIGFKASKNKGKYQLITALLNDFMQWIYNSLQEVDKAVLKDVKQEYKKQKKKNKDITEPPKKVFPLVYLLDEISYIARMKDAKTIQEFDLYKMIDTIMQLQKAKIYTRILDEEFFDSFKDKKCSVAEIRSILKCQPFIVVDENNQEILNKENMAQLFFYKDFTKIAMQILDSYESKAV